MDVTARRALLLLAAFQASLFFPCKPARAYDEYSHEWITRSAFSYLKSYPHVYPETTKWIEGQGDNASFFEETLVRSTVDTDYRTDLWLSAWFHDSIDGGESGGVVAMFTTLYHFLTVTVPGSYWDYDGYSYRENTHRGNDKYLSEPTVKVSGGESTALGGSPPAGHAIHGANLGIYDVGFRGNKELWRKMFLSGESAADAVFPPSYVPAEIAYRRMMESPRAPSNSTDSWREDEHLVTGVFSNTDLERTYWRGQVAGLPQYVNLLGMVMHLAQDVTVPHHVEDTSDRCHSEYERMVDQLACASASQLDYSKYYSGSYGGGGLRCDALYDAALVNQIIADQGLLDPAHPLSLQDRMVQAALNTSQWDWRIPSDKNYATLMPDGRYFSGDSCQDILSQQAVQAQAKYQFNLAVAETVSILEQAAHDYETTHAAGQTPLPPRLPVILSWFRAEP